ncbi:MAG: TIGR01777 family oxidoreductase [Methylococcaceae bacterium]
MEILITGGTGLIGRALCTALLKAGHDLTVLSRKPESVTIKCGTQVKAMQSLEQWHAEMRFDAVINLAGEPIIDAPWTDQRKKRLWDSRVTLTEKLVNRIENATHKPSLLLSGSATGYYGNSGDVLINESALPASDFGAQLCLAWENAALKAVDSNVRVCLLRTGLVLDSAGGLLGSMLTPFKYGLGARIGDGNQWMSWIHIDDYVAIVVKLLNDVNATGAYNMTAPQPSTNKEFTSSLAKVLHRPAFLIAPAWLMTLVLGKRAYLLLGGQRVLPAKVIAMGYEFTYPTLEKALEHALN